MPYKAELLLAKALMNPMKVLHSNILPMVEVHGLTLTIGTRVEEQQAHAPIQATG
jgi:hypothetical protein